MPAASEIRAAERQILLVGPYGVLGTGVIDAVAENPKWGITTAARRPPSTYRAQAAPSHISVDLMDREGTTKEDPAPVHAQGLVVRSGFQCCRLGRPGLAAKQADCEQSGG